LPSSKPTRFGDDDLGHQTHHAGQRYEALKAHAEKKLETYVDCAILVFFCLGLV
jgi:hypothetical protein